MKRLLAVTVCLLGVLLPGYGALAQQQDGEVLDAIVNYGEEEIYELSWESIPVDLETEWLDRADPEILEQEKKTIIEREFHRTHHEDMVKHWWEVDGEIPWDDEIPDEFELACIKWGSAYDICPEWLMATGWVEGHYKEDVISSNGKWWGTMQVAVYVHADVIKELGYEKEDMLTYDANVHVAAHLMRKLFDENVDCGIVANRYNGSSSNVPTKYARKVMNKSIALEEKHGKHTVNQ